MKQKQKYPNVKNTRSIRFFLILFLTLGVFSFLIYQGYLFFFRSGVDILLLGDTAVGIDSAREYVDKNGLSAPFKKVKKSIKKKDIVVASLRSPIAPKSDADHSTSELPPGFQPYGIAQIFANLGIDAFGMANSEVMGEGIDGLNDTLEALRESGIYSFGAGKDRNFANKPLTIKRNGLRIGIIPCFQGRKKNSDIFAGKTKPGITTSTESSIVSSIRKLKKKSDAVIVYVHWAYANRRVTKKQRELADKLVRAGADLIVGHGPHMAQRIESIQSVPIIYSLGDFVYHGKRRAAKKNLMQADYSLAARVHVTSRGIKNIELTPIRHSGKKIRYQPKRANLEESGLLFGKLMRIRDDCWKTKKKKALIDVENLRAKGTVPVDISEAFIRQLILFYPIMLICFISAFFIGAASRLFSHTIGPKTNRIIGLFALVFAIAAGLYLAWQKKSLIDDSFITFRYIKNFMAGNGLVFNIGERVEGYTNFLWAMVVAFFTWITKVEIPFVAFYGCLVCFVANLITIWLLGKKLSAKQPGQTYIPIAVVWLALQHSFHSYATTGMETMFASWMVNLAVFSILLPKRKLGSGLAGLFLILATMTRPDHAIFYVCMAAALAYRVVFDLWKVREKKEKVVAELKSALIEAGAFALPFVGYLGYLLWKFYYYGSIVPNTYYAKSANLSYWPQGWNFTRITGLSMNLEIIVPLFLLWLVLGRTSRTFKGFAGLSVVCYMFYVAKIGGDFMMGRFYISLLPLLLLGIEQLIHQLARKVERKPAWSAILIAALVAGSVHGLRIIPPGKTMRGITDESTYYLVAELSPLTIVKGNSKRPWAMQGKLFKKVFKDRGMTPLIAAGGIGMCGYFSEMPILDKRGLVDPVVAHRPLESRGKPGHEKRATSTYMDARKVMFITNPSRTRGYKNFSIEGNKMYPWWIRRYENEFMDHLSEVSPEFRFVRFPDYLDKNFKSWSKLDTFAAAKKMAEYDHYYFMNNDDSERRKRYLDRFIQWHDFENGYYEGVVAEGAFKDGIVYPAKEGLYSIESFQAKACIATPAEDDKPRTGKLTFPSFIVTGKTLGFLIGGEKNPNKVAAVLYVEGEEVERWSGRGDEKLRPVRVNVSKYEGKNAQLILVDESDTGRLLFDMFFEG